MLTRLTILRLLLVATIMFAEPLSCPGQTHHGFTGMDMLKFCGVTVKTMDDTSFQESPTGYFEDGVCVGMVGGIYQTSDISCPSPESTVGQAIRVVLKFLQDHPEKLHEKAPFLIEESLQQAFPCKKRPT